VSSIVRSLKGVAVAALFALAGGLQAAHAYPDRPIQMVVPFAPGGGTDVIARLLGEKLTGVLGQQIVIDNKPGAGGTLGTDFAAHADADGYTTLILNALTHTASQNLYAEIGYDPVTDFKAIGQIGTTPYYLIVNPEFPAKDFESFVKLVKENPDAYNYASAGVGSAPHLAMELLLRATDLKIQHIPYKGSGPALNDAVAGVVPILIDSSSATQLIKAGKLRALAVTGESRSSVLPDVPTFAEVGLPEYDVQGNWGIAVPTGTPDDVTAVLEDALKTVMDDEAFKTALEAQGIVPYYASAEAFQATLESEAKKWADLIQAANIKP
jgi:tripartite-type tricarboxylate transporter receptor subunit TctC